MRIYLAASFRDREQIRLYADWLQCLEHEITSRWINSTNQSDPLNDPLLCRTAAEECLQDVNAAELVVFFSEGISVGKHIEFGYALAQGKQIVVIGPATSVFHHLPGIRHLNTLAEFERSIQQ